MDLLSMINEVYILLYYPSIDRMDAWTNLFHTMLTLSFLLCFDIHIYTVCADR